MHKLYEIGIEYNGEFEESDYCVFEDEKSALEFVKKQTIKVMITTCAENKFDALNKLSQKLFSKVAEEITNEDIDNLPTTKLNSLYKSLLPFQDKANGVKGYFAEEVPFFTDENDNKFKITLEPLK